MWKEVSEIRGLTKAETHPLGAILRDSVVAVDKKLAKIGHFVQALLDDEIVGHTNEREVQFLHARAAFGDLHQSRLVELVDRVQVEELQRVARVRDDSFDRCVLGERDAVQRQATEAGVHPVGEERLEARRLDL